MKTKIVLAFQGSGKSFLTKNLPELHCKDMDFKYYRGKPNWEQEYIKTLQTNMEMGIYDFIFCNISEDIMRLLKNAGIEFYVVTPLWHDDAEREGRRFQKIKSILFGRYVLRKEQTPDNVKWLNRIKRHFDEWTAFSFFTKYVPEDHIIPLTGEKDTLYDALYDSIKALVLKRVSNQFPGN